MHAKQQVWVTAAGDTANQWDEVLVLNVSVLYRSREEKTLKSLSHVCTRKQNVNASISSPSRTLKVSISF